MPFVPVVIPSGRYRKPECSYATRTRSGIDFVCLRFSPLLLERLHWRRFNRVAVAVDWDARRVMLVESERSNPDARALGHEGGRQLSLRLPRIGALAELFPKSPERQMVPVVSAEPGRLVIAVRSLKAAS